MLLLLKKIQSHHEDHEELKGFRNNRPSFVLFVSFVVHLTLPFPRAILL